MDSGRKVECALGKSDVPDVVAIVVRADDHVAIVRTFELLFRVLDLIEKDVLLVSLVGDHFERIHLEKSLRIDLLQVREHVVRTVVNAGLIAKNEDHLKVEAACFEAAGWTLHCVAVLSVIDEEESGSRSQAGQIDRKQIADRFVHQAFRAPHSNQVHRLVFDRVEVQKVALDLVVHRRPQVVDHREIMNQDDLVSLFILVVRDQ